jgi:hypothetical protein
MAALHNSMLQSADQTLVILSMQWLLQFGL